MLEQKDNLKFQYSCNNMPDILNNFQEEYISENEKEISFEEFIEYIDEEYFCDCGQTGYGNTNILLEMIKFPYNFKFYHCKFEEQNIVYFQWSAIEYYFFNENLLEEMDKYLNNK